ncbi:MAG: cell division protein ZapB [Thermodesulfobacteriota bacterium]
MGLDELDQFDLLEERVDSLISLVNSLKQENASLDKQVREGGAKLRALENEIEGLRADRDAVRERIAALLKRIGEFT